MKNKEFKSKGITTATRVILWLMMVGVFMINAILLPELAREEKVSNPNAGPVWPFLIGAWVLTLPIFAALRETFKLLNYIDKRIAFSDKSVTAIKNIKISAVVFAILAATASLAVIIIGKTIDPTEDFAPVASIGIVFTFSSVVIATFTATLQRFLQEALQMKEENELTI